MIFGHNGINYKTEDPSSCPHCHNGIEPVYISLYTGKGPGDADLCYSIWKCTYRECRRLFIAEHIIKGPGEIWFKGFLDGTPLGPHWPESILNLPSKFIVTYMQALQAESLGLDEISGMGFRKAIEYLVKDYLIQRNSALKGTIEDKSLSMAISDNFNDPQENDLKELLLRATWLGNDLTHYLKYHENFSIVDLKELIKLVVDEIHSIEQKRHYIANIQSKYEK
jgi:hypothetical protein